jgi:hypothetical protein
MHLVLRPAELLAVAGHAHVVMTMLAGHVMPYEPLQASPSVSYFLYNCSTCSARRSRWIQQLDHKQLDHSYPVGGPVTETCPLPHSAPCGCCMRKPCLDIYPPTKRVPLYCSFSRSRGAPGCYRLFGLPRGIHTFFGPGSSVEGRSN